MVVQKHPTTPRVAIHVLESVNYQTTYIVRHLLGYKCYYKDTNSKNRVIDESDLL